MMKKKDNIEIKRFNKDYLIGLTSEEVSYMKEHHMENKTKKISQKSYFEIVLKNLFNPFNILMYVIALILFLLVGPDVIGNLMFLGIIFLNSIIGIVQECKAKHTLEKLKLLSASKTKVIRDGVESEITEKEIVLDDILKLSSGDQIPADSIIIFEDAKIEVNESLLTGESLPVKKDINDSLLAGSYIVSGSCYARVDKVGEDTYIRSLEANAQTFKKPESKLMISIRKTMNILLAVAIPLALLVFWKNFMMPTMTKAFTPSIINVPNDIKNALFYGGVTIAYMVPCGMLLLASVAMMTGVVQLANHKTLAQDLCSVESLSRVDTLCLDKTGTLTDGTMTVDSFEVLDKDFSNEQLLWIISSYLHAFKDNNLTSTALLEYLKDVEIKYPFIHQIQFSSERKYSCVELESLGWFAFGAPEYLNDDEEILNKVKSHTKNGSRVLLLCQIKGQVLEDGTLPKERKPIGMFVIRDNIRPEVFETMKWFNENDVDIKVISGDNVDTVRYIAEHCGINNADRYIDMSKVEDKDIEEAALHYSIFGRTSPEQKAKIVDSLKKNGRTVAATGDGINDIIFLKKADCAIALAGGAQATKNIANLVLLDSNFSNLKEAVFQGRRVINNVQRSASLFVMKDFLWLMITLMPFIFYIPHAIEPTVMTLVNIFITGIATFFIALEPDKTRVKEDFTHSVLKNAFLSASFMFIPVLGVIVTLLIINGRNISAENISEWICAISLTITISGLIVFYQQCKPFTKYRRILYIATVIVILSALLFCPQFFIRNNSELLKEINSHGEGNKIYLILKNIWDYKFYVFYGYNNPVDYASFSFGLIKWYHWLYIGIYALIAIPLYYLHNKFFGRIVDKYIFKDKKVEGNL